MLVSSDSKLATALSAAGTIAATAMVIRSFARELLPPECNDYVSSYVRSFSSAFSNQLTMVIDEFDGLDINEIYQSAEIYLGPKSSPKARRLRISRPEKEKHYNITMEKDQEITDTYMGQKFKWVWICRKSETTPNPSSSALTIARSFELTFHRKNRDLVINSYLPHITSEARNKKHEKKTIKIFTVDYENMYNPKDMWAPVTFDHPATFETLAMDPEQKDLIFKDLERFVKRKDYYRKVGKAWKRGYLLYGPPGTGKSSLIAAIANYLNFDVYDLEITELRRNSELRKLLLGTANKSILVVEDIDCTRLDFQEKLSNRSDADNDNNFPFYHKEEESKVTLSGLLNFVDGLWSSCGDERIIIFTTNHVERLDPALLRPGRMDVHINMSYCTPCGFKLLATNYLGIKEHALFGKIEGLIPAAKTTPAEVAEELLKNGDDPDVALQAFIDFIHNKTDQQQKPAHDEKPKSETEEGF